MNETENQNQTKKKRFRPIIYIPLFLLLCYCGYYVIFCPIAYMVNYTISRNAKTAYTHAGTIPLVDRGLQIEGVISGDRLKLADGRIFVLQSVTAPNSKSTCFEESRGALAQSVKTGKHIAHSQLNPVPDSKNTFETQLFVFQSWGGCGCTPSYCRVPHWSSVNDHMLSKGWVWSDDASVKRPEIYAMAYGLGIWQDTEMVRQHANFASLSKELLSVSENSHNRGREPWIEMCQILCKAWPQKAVPILEKRYEITREVTLLAYAAAIGHWDMMDQFVQAFIYPTEKYQEEYRHKRLRDFNRLLGTDFGNYRYLYDWYRDNRKKFVFQPDSCWKPLLCQLSVPQKTEYDNSSYLIGPPKSLKDDSTIPIEELWVSQIRESGTIWKLHNGKIYYRNCIDFAFCKNIMIVATGEGKVSGIDIDSSRTLWERDILLHSNRLIANIRNTFLVETKSGDFICLDSESGQTKWTLPGCSTASYPFCGRPRIAPVLIGDWIIIRGKNQLLWIDPDSGQVVRRSEKSSHMISSQPVCWEDKMYVTEGDERVMAISWKTGQLIWQAPLKSCEEGDRHIIVRALKEGVLLSEENAIKLLSHESGKVIWARRFWKSKFRPVVEATPEYLLALVPDKYIERKDPWGKIVKERLNAGVLVVFRREDRSLLEQWRISKTEITFHNGILATDDQVYLGEPLRCLKIWPQ